MERYARDREERFTNVGALKNEIKIDPSDRYIRKTELNDSDEDKQNSSWQKNKSVHFETKK